MRIELLYYPECPSHERALELIRDALALEGIHADIQLIRIGSWGHPPSVSTGVKCSRSPTCLTASPVACSSTKMGDRRLCPRSQRCVPLCATHSLRR
jgi:hypothetical protein